MVQNEKKKLQLAEFQLIGVYFCCLGRIRTLTGGTRIRRATITPQGIVQIFMGAKLAKIIHNAQINF